jgi:hypothetical protein
MPFFAAVGAFYFAVGLSMSAQGPGGQAGQGRGGGGGGQRGGRAQQGPARDPGSQQDATGTAVISGSVSVTGAATGVRRAQVILSGGGPSSLLGRGRGGVRSALTDSEGRFAFVGLPEGRFVLTVSKPGFASMSYGAKRPGRQGTPIQLAEGQILTNVNVALPKGSVLTGIVVDELGEPAPNTQVRAFRYVLQNGERTLQGAGSDQTDDRGVYRIFQLLPGDYLVSAVPRNVNASMFGPQLQAQIQPILDQVQAAGGVNVLAGAFGAAPGFGDVIASGRGQQLLAQVQELTQSLPADQPTSYAPVYYPGTTSPAQAGRISLGGGEERSGVDFQLQLVPTARLEGRVTGADLSTTPGAQVMLQMARTQDAASIPGLGMSMARVNGDGAFTFQNVTPGDYRLLVRAPILPPEAAQNTPGGRGGRGRGGLFANATQVLWASADVSVTGRDVTDLTLSLQPGMTLSGRLAFDSASATPPADLSQVRLNLVASDGQSFPMGPLPQQVDANGNFTITGVVPGRYQLRAGIGGRGFGPGLGPGLGPGRGALANAQNSASQSTANWALEAAVLNGRDVLDFPLDIEPNDALSGMVLTFTDRVQELSGTLQDAMGRPTPDYTIVLFPADNRYWMPQSRRILSTRPSTDGTFSLRGFPAGQYRLAAVTDAEPGEWYDPAFLTQIVPASMPVTIAEGERKTQDIRLAGAAGQ